MKKLKISPDAEMEFREASEFYRSISPLLKSKFIEKYKSTIKYISMYSEGSPLLEPGIRHHVMDIFPFSVVYIIREDFIYIIAVTHHSRHPDYWKDRIKDIPEK